MAHLRALPVAMIIALGLGPAASAFAWLDDEFDVDCTTQWDKSPASGSCSAITVLQKPKGVCVLSAMCSNTSKERIENQSSWTLDSMSKLVNNNGKLSGGVSPSNPGW